MNRLRRHFPFTAEQTINVMSEMGPLVTMFVVNFALGVEAGVWSLIGTTFLALVVSLIVLRRPPIMPFIAGAVTISFGGLTLWTGDSFWVQFKVTIFNALVAAMLYIGLRRRKYFFEFVFGKTFRYTEKGWYQLTRNVAIFFLVTAIANEAVRVGFDDVSLACPSAWRWLVRKETIDGLDIWMMFKLFVVMPLTSLYLVWQVRLMQKHRIPEASQQRPWT